MISGWNCGDGLAAIKDLHLDRKDLRLNPVYVSE